MNLQFTLEMFQLRRNIDNNPEAVPKELKSLVDMRNKALTNENMGIDDFKEFWEFCSTLPFDSPFRLPPLYLENTTLCRLMSDVIHQLYVREDRKVNNERNVGHILINGVQGVGKTTILRAVALGVCILMNRLVPITFEFQANDDLLTSPRNLCAEVLQWMGVSKELTQDFDVADFVAKFYELGHSVCFVLDEIQRLYREDDGKGAIYATEITQFSRLGQTFEVLSGTAVNLHEYLFHSLSNKSWKNKGYPNFNHTLYTSCHIPALRTIEELKNYIEVRYRAYYNSISVECLEDNLRVLLCYTGGIGRLIDQVVSQVESLSISSKIMMFQSKFISRFEEILRYCIKNVPNCIEIISMLLQLPSYRVLFDEKDEAYRNALDRLPCEGYSEIFIVESLDVLGHNRSDAYQLITNCINVGLLYKDPITTCIQFVRPYDAVICVTCQNEDIRVKIMLSIIRVMLEGIIVDKKEARVYVNASRVLEDFVRGGVLRELGVHFKHRTVRIVDGNLMVKFKNETITKMVDLDPNNFMNEMFSWVGEKGVDGFYLTWDKGWVLVMWQCKGDAVRQTLGEGCIETAINNFTSCSHRLYKVDDTQIGGILVKLAVGVAMLLRSLACCNIDVVKVQTHLHSTKKVKNLLTTFKIPHEVRCTHSGSPSIRAAFANLNIGLSTETLTFYNKRSDNIHIFEISKNRRVRVCHRNGKNITSFENSFAAVSENGTEAFEIVDSLVTYTLDIRERSDVNDFAQVCTLFAKLCATLLHALFLSFNLDVQRVVGIVLMKADAAVLTSDSCPSVNTEVLLNLTEDLDKCDVFCSKELDAKLSTFEVDLSITCGIDWIVDAVEEIHRDAARKILKDDNRVISLSSLTLSDVSPSSTQNTSSDRKFHELISTLREHLNIFDQNSANVLRVAIQDLNLKEEIFEHMTLMEKADYLVKLIGV